jgi:hypothetical protein
MQTTGGTLNVQAHRVCVIYDPANGRVLHIHHDIALPGGRPAGENEIEAAALGQLRKRGRLTDQLRVLHVKPEELRPDVRYSVDLIEKSLVPR